MTVTVGIDGYNLALPKGTGIATYARTLGLTVASLGWRTMGLFDVDAGPSAHMQEALFFERLERPLKAKKSLYARMMAKRPPMPAVREFMLSSVDVRPLADRLPGFDRIATGERLFQAAFRHFRKNGQFATVHLNTPPDIMHWTCPLPIRIANTRNIYTIHDLVPLRMPYMTLDDKGLYHGLIAGCVEAADHLCSVSDVTARELGEMFPGAADKVTTTYQTCDIANMADKLSAKEGDMVVRRFGLTSGGYFLFYGAVEPKKNVARLIEAHTRLDSATPLVIVTGRSWNSTAEDSLLDQLGNRDGKLIVMEYLTRGMLQALITHARAVTFPSLHEGFGLPVLEAMQLGVPVLTGNSGGVIEVAGDAALIIDPYDVAAMRRGLEQLDGDAALRTTLSEKGRLQAERFSPAQYAKTMASVYGQLLNEDRPDV